MNPSFSFLFVLLLPLTTQVRADWPQWRGPDRNGIARDADLPDGWAEDFVPAKLWEIEGIPSDHYGGHGSAVIANGSVYLAVVWHRDEPTSSRILTSRILADLGYRTHGFSPALTAKFEADRLAMSPRLRGDAQKQWMESWMTENLSESQVLKLKSWVLGRFKAGRTAIPLADFEIVRPIVDREFENVAALQEWVEAQAWTDPATARKVLDAVPNTKVAANDVILCLNLEDGSERWRFEVPGRPAGRGASSTPAVKDGRVYAVLSSQVYALDAASGEPVWVTPFESKRGFAFSPLVHEDIVLVNTGRLLALDTATGALRWQNQDVKLTNSSAVVWNDLVLCNASRELAAIDIATGETRWTRAAGGDATPVVQGDYCVVPSRTEGQSLTAFALSPEGARQLWAKDFLARRYGASPIIHEGAVYHLGSARHLCVDLKTGETRWEVERQSNLSSPVLADGKLLILENNGGFLTMIAADPSTHRILGRVKVSALGCTTPALDESRAVLRTRDRLICVDLKRAAEAP